MPPTKLGVELDRSRISWQQIVELLGVIGVIGSLVFVALEIRQNTDAVRSSTIQAIAELSYDSTITLVNNNELRAARLAAESGEMTADQVSQLDSWYSALMRIQQNRLLQAQLGILDIEDAMQIGGRARAYRQPYFENYWSRRKHHYPLEFQEYIEEHVLVLNDAE